MSSYDYIYQGPNTSPINKYHQWYIDIIHNRQVNVPDTVKIPCENHHIIPDSLGGTNDRDNMVYLTLREHFVVHMLLVKFLEGSVKYKMLKALDWFNNSGKQYCNSRLYEAARLEAKKFKSYINLETEEYSWFKEDPGEGWVQQGVSSGVTSWYNEFTDTYTTAKESPGDDWIQQGINRGKTSWYNESTDTFTLSKECPGNGWVKRATQEGKKFWYNESTDTYRYVGECPGEGWSLQGVSTDMTSWYDESTDTYTRSKECPGKGWVQQGHNKDAKYWYNPETCESVLASDKPGDGWINGQGPKGGTFKGWYCHVDYGKFITSDELAKLIGVSASGVRLMCGKSCDKTINRNSMGVNKFLQSLDFDPIGMTYRELGFYFLPKPAK